MFVPLGSPLGIHGEVPIWHTVIRCGFAPPANHFATPGWKTKYLLVPSPVTLGLEQTTTKTQCPPSQQRPLGIQRLNIMPCQGVYTTKHDLHAPIKYAQHRINSVSAMTTTITYLLLNNSSKHTRFLINFIEQVPVEHFHTGSFQILRMGGRHLNENQGTCKCQGPY